VTHPIGSKYSPVEKLSISLAICMVVRSYAQQNLMKYCKFKWNYIGSKVDLKWNYAPLFCSFSQDEGEKKTI
jgi:hypothetical protein